MKKIEDHVLWVTTTLCIINIVVSFLAFFVSIWDPTFHVGWIFKGFNIGMILNSILLGTMIAQKKGHQSADALAGWLLAYLLSIASMVMSIGWLGHQ